MIDKALVLKSIKDLIKECGNHSKCSTCAFYDKEDRNFLCIIKNTEEMPSKWHIK